MAETEAARSSKSSFLKKSKWGKIFKEQDNASDNADRGRQTDNANGSAPPFKLNEDVVDFLKPSTEKRPKIDIAIAQRWPDAHEVRKASDNSSAQTGGRFVTKQVRKQGLHVSFVRAAPEIIGEGGDEATDPPREVSRTKAAVSRSVSDRRPNDSEWSPSPPLDSTASRLPPPPQLTKQEGGAHMRRPMQRAYTSHNETSPAVQRKHASPPQETVPHKPSIGRTPTGMEAYNPSDHTPLDTPIDTSGLDVILDDSAAQDERPRTRDRPTIDTGAAQSRSIPRRPVEGSATRKNYGGLSSNDAASPVAQKRREQSVSEGMAFRRASMRIKQKDEDDDSPPQRSKGPSPSAQTSKPLPRQRQESPPAANDYETLFSPAGQHPLSTPSQQQSALSDGTHRPAVSPPSEYDTPFTSPPDAPNPFDDPKYIQRHSEDAPSGASSPFESQSLRQATRMTAGRRSQQSSPAHPGHGRNPSGTQERAQYPTQSISQRQPVPQISQPDPATHHQRVPSREECYRQQNMPLGDVSPQHRRAPSKDDSPKREDRPRAGYVATSRAATLSPSSQKMHVPQEPLIDRSISPGNMRNRMFDQSAPSPDKPQIFSRPNGSSQNVNHFPPSTSHSRAASRDSNHSPLAHSPAANGHVKLASSRSSQQLTNRTQSPANNSPRASLLGPGRSGPSPKPLSSLGTSPNLYASPDDYFAAGTLPTKSHAAHLRQEEAERPRPSSAGSSHSFTRPSNSPHPPDHGDAAADAAYVDFASRVAHMRGVFSLTAEKELPRDRCSPSVWLRAGLWWYLRGKSGLESLLQQKRPDDRRELLTQAHVDLAKAWWILSDPLEAYDTLGEASPSSARSGEDSEHQMLQRGVAVLRQHIRSLSLSASKAHLLPPTQSLIQGQDTSIWLKYPRFTSDAAAVLSGNASSSVLVEEPNRVPDPYEMLPLGDSRDAFCYGRFLVEVSVNTDEAETDRVVMKCMMTVVRGRKDYQTSIAIASQNDLVNIKVAPSRNERKGLTWSDVSWKSNSDGMILHLPHNFDLSVRMQERDFRAVWNLSEYARKVENSLRPEPDEMMIHEARLAELQYADSSNSSAFPADKISGCMALVFERTAEHRDGSGVRKVHRGHRLLLITDPGHKTLSSASHELGRHSPLYFEFMTDSAANGTTAMVIRAREEKRQCRILMVFPDAGGRQALYDVLNGLSVGPDEIIVGKAALARLNIEPASQTDGFSQSAHPALANLQWQRLAVINSRPKNPNLKIPETVESEHLRILARHATGCITDRLNLGKGEMLLRLPITSSHTLQMLREPHEDTTMSVDTRHADPQVAHGIGQLLQTVLEQPTIRSFTFASQDDLHAFQAAITGFVVRFEGMAISLGIARRRMVVPIYKKWEASNVRIQIVAREGVVKLVAFMDDFSHADSLCFQVKSTDTFELIKGDEKKKKKWAVKMVDAKFSLPSQEKGEVKEEDRLQRRFVNLEGLEYAEEHDDITIAFDTEHDRDRFAEVLPASTAASRGISLKRRI